MTCDQALSQLSEARSGGPSPALAAHLADCDECRAAADLRRQVRSLLGGIEMPVALTERLTTVANEHLTHQLRARSFETPLGWSALAYTDGGIVLIRRSEGSAADAYERLRERLGEFVAQERPRDDIGGSAVRKLLAYHDGRRVRFDEPLDLSLVPSFTRQVLQATARIPYGEVRPYAWVARQVGRPKATRAVGQALNINPVAPIIPCHRVIASDNTLGGYGGGPEMKRWLLRLEGYLPASS
ncbi:MAG: methylated-DNA--[protein]-cysteine S-methyltransferase [Dehalococcoidia bacterium]